MVPVGVAKQACNPVCICAVARGAAQGILSDG